MSRRCKKYVFLRLINDYSLCINIYSENLQDGLGISEDLSILARENISYRDDTVYRQKKTCKITFFSHIVQYLRVELAILCMFHRSLITGCDLQNFLAQGVWQTDRQTPRHPHELYHYHVLAKLKKIFSH